MKKLLLLLNTLLFLTSIASAQSLTITQSFQAIPNSSVLAPYKNQFGSWEQADGFPYALMVAQFHMTVKIILSVIDIKLILLSV